MSIGLKMLMPDNEYGVLGDAFLSAGSTGALHACSTLIVHKLPGVRRSGIATILPFSHPLFLMDAGANPKITEEYLVQWAIMGSIYMKKYSASKILASGFSTTEPKRAKALTYLLLLTGFFAHQT